MQAAANSTQTVDVSDVERFEQSVRVLVRMVQSYVPQIVAGRNVIASAAAADVVSELARLRAASDQMAAAVERLTALDGQIGDGRDVFLSAKLREQARSVQAASADLIPRLVADGKTEQSRRVASSVLLSALEFPYQVQLQIERADDVVVEKKLGAWRGVGAADNTIRRSLAEMCSKGQITADELTAALNLKALLDKEQRSASLQSSMRERQCGNVDIHEIKWKAARAADEIKGLRQYWADDMAASPHAGERATYSLICECVLRDGLTFSQTARQLKGAGRDQVRKRFRRALQSAAGFMRISAPVVRMRWARDADAVPMGRGVDEGE